MMDLAQKILTLPGVINYDGCIFELQLFCGGASELKLAYKISFVNKDSRHYKDFATHNFWHNPFYLHQRCDVLYLYEGIEDEESLHEAIDDCHKFLQQNNFVQP
jgi:hypothetical protein